MELPNAGQAVVPRNKVENYLLNLGHPDGGSKARFFVQFGFRREAWTVLAEALGRHAREHPVAGSITDPDGVTYIVEGTLETPSARKPHVRSVWLVETGELAPRFITAYPLPA
jgi:hypothetical protein